MRDGNAAQIVASTARRRKQDLSRRDRDERIRRPVPEQGAIRLPTNRNLVDDTVLAADE
jgi:hypothetical protein